MSHPSLDHAAVAASRPLELAVVLPTHRTVEGVLRLALPPLLVVGVAGQAFALARVPPARPFLTLPTSALTFLLVAVLLASWATHIVVCVANGLWSFLVLGLLLVPVALLHGLTVLVTAWL